ncbi:MAG: hypothetical protein Fur0037_11250 [Planctomycetota bacterium]
MQNPNIDPGFEEYRRERARRRAYSGEPGAIARKGDSALRELEEAEAREARDRLMAREVHDFFNSATLKAASIVEKVAETAKAELSERLSHEMQDFLLDSLERMNDLVMDLMGRQPRVAETDVQPTVQNLVGPLLDGFRYDGTAELDDKHIGQNPFDTDPSEVKKELGQSDADDRCAEDPPEIDVLRDKADIGAIERGSEIGIEDHLVAEVLGDQGEDAPRAQETGASHETEGSRDRPAETRSEPAPAQDLERFKEALKNLVRTGMMTRDEAKLAWLAKTGRV